MSKHILWLCGLIFFKFSSALAMRALDKNDQVYMQYRWRSLPRDKDYMSEVLSLPVGDALNFDDDKKKICQKEYQQLLMHNCPTKLKEIISLYTQLAESNDEKPDGSLEEIKKILPSKILLTGPMGCGKSSLAELIAFKSGRPTMKIMPVIANEFQNSGLENLNRLFLPLLESNKSQVLIFDDFTWYTNRLQISHDTESGLAERFWTLLDECEKNKNILVILTSYKKNLPEEITSRFKRSHFIIPQPDLEIKKLILKYYLGSHHNITDNQLGLIKTKNFSLRWLESLCMSARFTARMRESSSRDLKLTVEKAKYNAGDRKIESKSNSETPFLVTKDDLDEAFKKKEETERLFRGSIFYRLSKKINFSLYTPWIISTISGIVISKLYQHLRQETQRYENSCLRRP